MKEGIQNIQIEIATTVKSRFKIIVFQGSTFKKYLKK